MLYTFKKKINTIKIQVP